jgi:hypothetical protein
MAFISSGQWNANAGVEINAATDAATDAAARSRTFIVASLRPNASEVGKPTSLQLS